VRLAIASHPNAALVDLLLLYEMTGFPSIKIQVLRHPLLTYAKRRELTLGTDWDIQREIAAAPELPLSVVAALIASDDADVVAALRSNPTVSEDDIVMAALLNGPLL
jgi:hypothetical protein